MIKIAIIGFGKLGKSLANILRVKENSLEIAAWDVVATGDPRQKQTCEEAVKNASVVFFVVPSAFFGESVNNAAPHVSNKSVVVSCTKGLDGKSGLLPISILEKSLPKNTNAVLSGPMLSEELESNLPTKATLSSRKTKELERVREIFRNTSLELEICGDPVGVSWWGILKNIYALGFGLSDGLGLGSNFRSCLALQAVKEIQLIVKSQKGKTESVFSYAGLSDFLATGFSSKSRNYSYGFNFLKQENRNENLAEGAKNLNIVFQKTEKIKLPLLLALKNIFTENQNPKEELLKAIK